MSATSTKDLGLGSKIEKKDVSVYVDGVVDPENKIVPVAITKDNDDDSYGANGVLTEVFYDDDADTVTITEVNTYVGEISKTVKATSKKDAYVVVIPEGVKPTSMKNSESSRPPLPSMMTLMFCTPTPRMPRRSSPLRLLSPSPARLPALRTRPRFGMPTRLSTSRTPLTSSPTRPMA